MTIGFDGFSAVYDNKHSRNYSRLLLDALSQHCEDNTYFVYSPSLIDNAYLTPIMSRGNVHVKIQRNGITTFMWRSVYGVLKSIKRHHVQLYHGLCGQLPLSISSKKTPTVVTFESTAFARSHNIKLTKKKFMARKACSLASAIITLTEQSKQDLVEAFHVEPERIAVIPPCYSSHFHDNLNATLTAKAQSKYHLPERYIFMEGDVDKNTHAIEIIQALAQCDDKDLHLVLAGHSNHKYMRKIQDAAAQAGIAHRLVHLPPVRTAYLPGIMSSATMCILAQTSGTFPYPVIYAQTIGIPVIASQSQKCITGEGALLIDPNNIDDIKAAINTIVNDNDQRQLIVTEAHKHAQAYTPQSVAMAHNAIYERLLSQL